MAFNDPFAPFPSDTAPHPEPPAAPESESQAEPTDEEQMLDGLAESLVTKDGTPYLDTLADDAEPADAELDLDTEPEPEATEEPQTGEAFWKTQAERMQEQLRLNQAMFQRWQQMYSPLERTVSFLDQRTQKLEEVDRQQAEMVRQELAPEPGTPERAAWDAEQIQKKIDDGLAQARRDAEQQRTQALDQQILNAVGEVAHRPEYQELEAAFTNWRSREAAARGVPVEQIRNVVLGEAAQLFRAWAGQGQHPVRALAEYTRAYGGWEPSWLNAAPAPEAAPAVPVAPQQTPGLAAAQARSQLAAQAAPPAGGKSALTNQLLDIDQMNDAQLKKYMAQLGNGDEQRGWETWFAKSGGAVAMP